jgi:hypothetical protein
MMHATVPVGCVLRQRCCNCIFQSFSQLDDSGLAITCKANDSRHEVAPLLLVSTNNKNKEQQEDRASCMLPILRCLQQLLLLP